MPEGRRKDSDPKDYFGLRVLRTIQKEVDPELPVVILSSMDSKKIVREWSKGGALRFIDRNAEDAAAQLEQSLHKFGLIPDVSGKIKGGSVPFLKALREARRLGSEDHVLLVGETGTGKELFAKFIHKKAKESDPSRPYVVVDLQTIPADFIGTELFGFTEKAPVDAKGPFKGAFQQADGGDLFLDEVGCVPRDVQTKLYRALQFGLIRPLGAEREIQVNVRVIAATDADPHVALNPQLHARFNHPGLRIPPLRERRDDIPELVEFFLAKGLEKNEEKKTVDGDAMKAMQTYSWPKNVRELEHMVPRARSQTDSPYLMINHLPEEVSRTWRKHGSVSIDAPIENEGCSLEEDFPDKQKSDEDPTQSIDSSSPRLSGSVADLQFALLCYLEGALEKTKNQGRPDGEQANITAAYKNINNPEDVELLSNPTPTAKSFFKKLMSVHIETTRVSLAEYPLLSELWEVVPDGKPEKLVVSWKGKGMSN